MRILVSLLVANRAHLNGITVDPLRQPLGARVSLLYCAEAGRSGRFLENGLLHEPPHWKRSHCYRAEPHSRELDQKLPIGFAFIPLVVHSTIPASRELSKTLDADGVECRTATLPAASHRRGASSPPLLVPQQPNLSGHGDSISVSQAVISNVSALKKAVFAKIC